MSKEKKGTSAVISKKGNKTTYKCGKNAGVKKEPVKKDQGVSDV